MRRSFTRTPLGVCALAFLIGACDGPPRQQAVSQRASCESRTEGSRWAAAGTYRRTASIGGEETSWINEAGGVAVHDSLVFVYDAPEARVRVLTETLAPVRTFGRRGGGPGEMSPFTSRGIQGPQWQWLSMAGDTLVVFDGIAVHRFSPDGRFLGRAYHDAIRRIDLNDGSEMIAAVNGGLLSSWGGYYLSALRKGADQYRWSILHHTSGRPDSVLSFQLKPLPATRGSGVGFVGPAQASPVWASSRDCVVATDGGGGWLVRADVAGPGMDTVTFALPDVAPPPIDKEEIGRLSGMASKGETGYLEPSLEQRVAAVVVDPDGYAWVLPAQDTAGGRMRIVRISLATGQALQDTVPAFPVAFGRPGVFYARTNNPISGAAEVVRYEAGADGP